MALFIKADLTRAVMADMNLTYVIFDGAVLDGAVLDGCRMELAQLKSVSARGTRFRGADLTNADASYADMTAVDLSGANVYRLNVHGATFEPVVHGNGRSTMLGTDTDREIAELYDPIAVDRRLRRQRH